MNIYIKIFIIVFIVFPSRCIASRTPQITFPSATSPGSSGLQFENDFIRAKIKTCSYRIGLLIFFSDYYWFASYVYCVADKKNNDLLTYIIYDLGVMAILWMISIELMEVVVKTRDYLPETKP